MERKKPSGTQVGKGRHSRVVSLRLAFELDQGARRPVSDPKRYNFAFQGRVSNRSLGSERGLRFSAWWPDLQETLADPFWYAQLLLA